jgi:exopolysaccharide biosynthesis polyprenyl glycosylphosphotransferase
LKRVAPSRRGLKWGDQHTDEHRGEGDGRPALPGTRNGRSGSGPREGSGRDYRVVLSRVQGEATDRVSDGIIKKKTYVAPSRSAGAAAAELSLGKEDSSRVRGIGGRRVLVTLIGDLIALGITTLFALLILPVAPHLPIVGRSLAEFSEIRPPLLVIALMVPWTIFVMYGYGLYLSSARSINGWVVSEGLRGLTALSVAAWSMLVLTLLVEGSTRSLGYISVFWACEVVTVPLCRAAARAAIWQSSRLSERTLIVGAGAVGHLLGEKIAKHPEYNLTLVGYLDDGEPFGASRPAVTVVGRLEDLNDVIDGYAVSRVIIAFSRARHQQILDVVRTCADRGVRVNIVPRLFEILSSQTAMDDVEGIPLLDVAHVEMSRFNTIVKRVFDLLFGGALTVVALPLIGLLAVAIKLDSRGPVFFKQERMGRGGKVFRIFKLRSMHTNAEQLRYDLAEMNDYSGPMFKMKSDPRITRVGAVIRKWSLDEVPQLFNVMRGEMSLVGPRPLWVDEATRCRGWTKKRLDITPGITGLWQVTGRNDVPFDEMVKLDYMYVTGWTLSWDIKLLLETIPAVLGRRGAY